MPRKPPYTPVTAARLAPAPPNLFVGTSGWAYPSWKPGFYPADVPAKAFLHHYASVLPAVEVNYTFRTLPTVVQLAGWLAATPPGFQFSFKAPQRITHFRRLRDCDDEVQRFFQAIYPAGQAGKLGPVLFQLPPNLALDLPRLRAFLNYSVLQPPQRVRFAFEFRHPSWFTPDVYEVLRSAGAALCIADTDTLATPEIATAGFHCYRLRRDGGYTPAELATFARRFAQAAVQAPTYVFLRHQEEPTGALNAQTLLTDANSLAAPHRRHQEGSHASL